LVHRDKKKSKKGLRSLLLGRSYGELVQVNYYMLSLKKYKSKLGKAQTA